MRLAGADVQSFLQGLITNNMRHLAPEKPLYAALLTPQGKLLFDFFLYADDADVLMDVEASRMDELIKRLKMYKLRADVNLTEEPDLRVAALWGADVGHLPHDPRHPKAGARVVCTTEILEQLCTTFLAKKTDESAYDLHRLHLGLPDGTRDFIADKTFAAEIGLEALHGVDFAKGCYVGQEVTARTKHKGTVRKGLCMVALESGAMPQSGTPLLADGEEAGEMRSSAGNIGIAMLRFEYVGKPLTSPEGTLRAKLPAWAPEQAA